MRKPHPDRLRRRRRRRRSRRGRVRQHAARGRLRRHDHRRLRRAASALYAPGPHQAGAARGEAARRGALAARGVVPRAERRAADRLDCRRDRSRRAHASRSPGVRLSYGSLVLATGAEPRHLDFGADIGDRVHVLRSFADADEIRPHLGEGTRWLVVGGGFIGAEFAASAALTGSDVSLVMPQDVMLERAFGREVGAWFDSASAPARRAHLRGHERRIHHARGRCAPRAAGRRARADRRPRRRRRRRHPEHRARRARPASELALGGIAVDAALRTSEPGIYAIGDVAAYESELHGRRVRIEHWDVARAQGVHVAEQIIGSAAGAVPRAAVLLRHDGRLGVPRVRGPRRRPSRLPRLRRRRRHERGVPRRRRRAHRPDHRRPAGRSRRLRASSCSRARASSRTPSRTRGRLCASACTRLPW